MPNWCYNEIEMKREDAEKYLLAMRKDKDGEEKLTVDFNKLIPMPESLNVTCGSSNKYDIYAYLSNKGEKTVAQILAENNEKALNEMFGSFSPVTEILNQMASAFLDMAKDDISKSYDAGKQLVDNYTEHGATTWYDWRIQNWGTKWNACDTEIKENGDNVSVLFNTAWAPPINALNELAKHADFIDITHTEDDDRLDILEGKNGTLRRIPECTYQLQGTYRVSITAEDGLDLEQLKDIFDKMEDEDFKISLFVGIENKEDVIVQVLTKKDEYKALWTVGIVGDELERKIEEAFNENDLDYSTIEVEAEGDYIVKSLTPNHAYPEETGAFHFRKGTFEITSSSELIFSKEDFDKLTLEQKASFIQDASIAASITDKETSVSVKMEKTDTYREFEQQVAEQMALWNVKSMMFGIPYEILDRTIQKDAIDKVTTIEPPIMQKEETPKRDRANADLSRE